MIKEIIIATIFSGAFFIWTMCKAAGKADGYMDIRDK